MNELGISKHNLRMETWLPDTALGKVFLIENLVA